MSDIAMNLVWSESKSTRGSRLVMLALARMADDRGEVTLTLDEISRLTRLTDRSITKCLGELSSLGELIHQRGGGKANPNRYSILLIDRDHEASEDSSEKVPTSAAEPQEDGTYFSEVSSRNHAPKSASEKSTQREVELSPWRTRGDTPVGSITTVKKQACFPAVGNESKRSDRGSVKIPDGAEELVAAITSAGMLVGWRLTEPEWDRVTALADRWGPARLVEVVARRWNANRPPQSARYLLRIWADLPPHAPGTTLKGDVAPLGRRPGTWMPFRNAAESSAYQNGF